MQSGSQNGCSGGCITQGELQFQPCAAHSASDAIRCCMHAPRCVICLQLLRQAADTWPLHRPLRPNAGNVADPLYFDFIVGSQAAAASTAMRQGLQVRPCCTAASVLHSIVSVMALQRAAMQRAADWCLPWTASSPTIR